MVFFIFIISISLVDLCTSQFYAALYNNVTPDTSTFSIKTSVNQPELEATWKYFPYTTRHAFEKYGIWYFYGGKNYELGDKGFSAVLCGYGYFMETYQVGSIRFAGEEGISRLNLYSNVRHTSNETFIYNNQPVLTTKFRSLTLIGNIPVQLYLQTNYGGISYCIPASSFYCVRQIYDIIREIGIQEGDVKSLRFGCTSGATLLQLPTDQSGIRHQSDVVLEI